MTKYSTRIALTVFLAAAAAYGAASLPDDDAGGRRSADARYAESSATKPPVIMIVMDEFPVDVLLGPDGKIDAGRFPHFARLAREGTWYRNASTVYDSTTKAIPAILDGKLPRSAPRPNFTGHPQSVYDLFGRRGYRIVSSEEATAVCPPRYCPGARATRPAILPYLQEGRRERLQSFFEHDSPRPCQLLPQARPAAPRPAPVPALGQAEPRQLARPAAIHEQHARFLRRLPDAAQPAADPAPSGLRGP